MPRRKKSEEQIEQVKIIKTPPLVKGMKDVIPSDSKYWRLIMDTFHQLATDYSFIWIDTPVLEKQDLFVHAMGKNHTVVKKGLISFVDKNEKIVLRPDITPGVARSYIEHSIFNQAPPNKFWYLGKIYLQDKVSFIKHRELNQIGFEVYNAPSAAVDAELVMMVYQTLQQLELQSQVRVNSLGCLACRGEYKKALTAFIKSKRTAVCSECRAMAVKNPLAFLSCSSQKCQKIVDEAPQMVDYLCDSCHDHLFKVLETLDDLRVDYVLDSKMMNETQYYNGTIFSIVSKPEEKEDQQKTVENDEFSEDKILASGGRADYLVEMLGGQEIPSVNIKFCIERIIAELKEKKVEVKKQKAPHVYFAQLSEQAKRQAMKFIAELREHDFRVKVNFSKDSLKSQLDSAKKMNAKIVLILGQKESIDGTLLVRDMESGIQEVVSQKKAIKVIKKKLAELDK